MIEPSTQEQSEWPQATEHYVRDLEVEIKRLQTVLRDMWADLLTQARQYQADDGSPGPLSYIWGWRQHAETLRKAAKAAGSW